MDAVTYGSKNNGVAATGSGSPFVDDASATTFRRASVPSAALRTTSPFLTERELEDRLVPWNPAAEIVEETLATLHDEAFDEVLHDMVGEAAQIAAECRASEYGDSARGSLRVQQALADRFQPLASEAEQMIGEIAEATRELDLAATSETELDEVLEPLRPSIGPGAPVFEQFLGGLFDKVKKLARGAVNVVGRGIKAVGSFAFNQILGRLGGIIRPLLARVMSMGIGLLPPQYRAIAGQVAQRLGLAAKATQLLGAAASAVGIPAQAITGNAAPAAPSTPAAATPAHADTDGSDTPGDTVQAPAAPDVGELQSELDGRLTEMLLANDESEVQELASDYARSEVAPTNPTAEVDAARAAFVRELETLGEGEDPTPAVEHFLPLLLPVLRTGIQLVGRDRVVDALGGIVGKLIAPVAGAGIAPALGKAIVDTGLRTFLQSEVSPESLRRIGAQTIANAVEDTAREVAALPASVVSNPTLLESHAREAFDRAAAANFPGALLRPEHREGTEHGAWLAMPRTGKPLYKRYSHTFDVELTPQIAASVRTFGGGTLATFLREQLRLGLERPVRARAHVFEVLPGGRLSSIAAGESLPGLGSPGSWRMLHPLSPHAAAVLFHHPRLGRRAHGGHDALRPRVGERVFFLEVDGAPRRAATPVSHLRVKLDTAKDEVRVCIHLGETLAQQIATMVRARTRPASIVHELRVALGSHARALSHKHHGPRHAVAKEAVHWAWARLAEYFERSGAEFLQAADARPPGLTLRVAFEHAPGLDAIRAAAQGKGTGTLPGWPPSVVPPATIQVKAGHAP